MAESQALHRRNDSQTDAGSDRLQTPRSSNSSQASLENLPPVYLQNSIPGQSAEPSPSQLPSAELSPATPDDNEAAENIVAASSSSQESSDAETFDSELESASEQIDARDTQTDTAAREVNEGDAGEDGSENAAEPSAADEPQADEAATEQNRETTVSEEESRGEVVLSSTDVASTQPRASNAEETKLPDIPPLQLPRLNNIRVPFIPSPPKPAIERSKEIVQKTGSPPELHHAQIRQAVQRVSDVARNSQRQVIWRINLLAGDARLSFFEIAAEISRNVRSAIGAINGAIRATKRQIDDLVTGIERHFREHEALVGDELRESQENRSREVRDALLEGNTDLQQAHQELQTEFNRYLNPAKTNIRRIGTDGVVTLVEGPPGVSAGGSTNAPSPSTTPSPPAPAGEQKNMTAVQEDIDARYGRLEGNNIGKYVKHRAQPVVTRMYDGTQRQLTAAYNQQADAMDSYSVSFSINALQLVTPSVRSTDDDSPNREQASEQEHDAQVQEVTEGTEYNLGQIHKKQTDAKRFLDVELGPKLVEGLLKMEAKAVRSFQHQGKQTERMLQNTAAPTAKAYPDIVARVEAMLPNDKFLDVRKYLPSLLDARKSAKDLPDLQMQPLYERVKHSLAQAEEGKKKQIEAIGKSVDKGAQAVNDVAIKTSFDMDSFAYQVTGFMRAGGRENIRGAQDYALRIANDLLRTKDQADGQLNNLLSNYVENFNNNISAAGRNYFTAVSDFHDNIFGSESGVFKTIREENAEKLSEKSSVLNQNLTHADPDVVAGLVATNVLTLGASTGATVAYLVYSDADQSDVFTALGDLDWPGQAALEEYFNNETSYEGPLRTRINESLDEDDAAHARKLLSPNAADRARGRLNAAEASLSWTDFGISDEARQALLAGMSAEEREAADSAQMTRIGEEINSSWTMTDTEIRMQTGYLNGDLDQVLSARMEQNLSRARNNGDSAIQSAVQNIDQLARAELGRTQSAAFLQPQEIQGLINNAMVDFARHRPGESRTDISVEEAQRIFVDYATADRMVHYGAESPPTPIPIDQFVKDYVEEVVTNGFYVQREVEGRDEPVWETNREAQARSQAYQIHRAEAGYGEPSTENVTQFNAAFRNPALSRLEQRVAEARERAARDNQPVDPALLRELAQERERHESQMNRVARRLGMTDEQLERSGSATEWVAQHAAQAFAGEDAVPEGQERAHEPGMARFATEVIRNGRASVAAGVHVATEGWGTNEDLLRTVYSGRRRSEIEAAEAEWEERYDQDLNEYLGIREREWDTLDYAMLAISPAAGMALLAYRGGETSGDLAMELEILARGEPETDQDRLEIALLRAEQQQGRGTGFIGQLTMANTAENRDMNDRRRELAEMLLAEAQRLQGERPGRGQELPDADGVFMPDGRVNPVVAGLVFSTPRGANSDSARNQFTGTRDNLMQSMHELELSGRRYQSEQSRQESLMLAGITVLAIAATIILMAFGVGFVLAGMLVALGSGILTMAVKQGMRGERYGWEEAATDAAMTAIEVAAAGAGGALAGGFGTAGKLGSVVTAFNKLGPVAGPMAREALVGAVSSAAQVALQDGTYDQGVGKAFERIIGGGLKGAAVGAASAGLSELATNRMNSSLAQGLDGADLGRTANLGRGMGANARAMLTETISEGIGSVAGEGVAIIIEVSKGEFRGGLDDALRRMGENALKEMVSAAGRSAATSANKRRYGDLLAEARNKEQLTDSDLRALRMAGAAAGEPFEGLDAVRSRVVEGQRLLNSLPPEIRQHVQGLDVDNLRTLTDMLDSVALGGTSDTRQTLLREISDKAPQIDTIELTRQLEVANARRQAALEREQDTAAIEHQQRVRDQLAASMDPMVAERFRSMPIEGIDKLPELELELAAAMIRSGNFDQGQADALLRTARSSDPELDGFAFMRTLQSAVETTRLAQQAQLEIKAKQRAFVTEHAPDDARILFAGLPDEGIAKVKQLLQSEDAGTRQQQDELFRMAREVDPELTQDQFRSFIEKAVDSVHEVNQAKRESMREERKQRMDNIPDRLRDELSVLPDAALIELRIRQMEGDLSPAERQRLVEIALKEDPELSVERFNDALNEAMATETRHHPDEGAEKRMREELLAAVPQDLRASVEDVPILVMRDAEFESFTHSQTGQAVTLMINGRAVVVVRESADPAVLREEGIHVLQSKDPQWSSRIGALEEAHLRNWDELSLEQQMLLYSNKVELEIDAQQKLIRSLEADMASADTDQDVNRLRIQLEQAMASMQNLSNRRAEVAGIDSLDMANIKAGFSERPQWLDQPARLFSKEAEARTQPIETDQARTTEETAEEVDRASVDGDQAPLTPSVKALVAAEPLSVVKQRLLEGIDPSGRTAKDAARLMNTLDEQTIRDIDAAAPDGDMGRRLLRMAGDNPADTQATLRAVLQLPDAVRDQAVRKLVHDSQNAKAISESLVELNAITGKSVASEKMMIDLLASPDRQRLIDELNITLHQLKNNLGEKPFNDLLSISSDADIVQRFIQQVAGAKNQSEYIEALMKIKANLPETETTRVMAELARNLSDAPIKVAIIAKLSDLDIDNVAKFELVDGVIAHLKEIDSVISRVKLMAAVNTVIESGNKLGIDPAELGKILSGMLGTSTEARNRFQFLESSAILYKELVDVAGDKRADAVLDHLKQVLTTSEEIGTSEARNLEADLRNAARLLAESSDKGALLELFSKQLQSDDRSLTGGDPIEIKIQEAISKWPEFAASNPDYVKILNAATSELSIRERSVMAEFAPWFKELAKIRGITDEQGKIDLLRDLLTSNLGDDLSGASYNKIKEISSIIRNTVVDESLDLDVISVREYLDQQGISDKDIDNHLLATAEEFKQAFMEGRVPVTMHVEALIRQEQRVKTMLEIAERIGASTAGLQQKLTEVQGEMAFTVHMLTSPDFADCRPVVGFEVGNGFDQVWERVGADGRVTEFIIGEAKGPGATLGTSLKGEQMTPEWIMNTATELINQGGAARQLGERLIQAMVDGEPPIRGIVVTAGEEGQKAKVDDRGHFDYSGELIHQT